MRKIHLLGLAVVAVFAFTAISASAAFAETEFLVSGLTATAGQQVEGSGELLLEDMKGGLFGEGVDLLCSGNVLAEFASATDLNIITIYALGATDPNTLGSATVGCEVHSGSCGTAKATAIHLDWLVQLELAPTAVTNLASGEGGEPGWNVECSLKIEDECVGKTIVESKNLSTGEVESVFNEATETPANCSRGGAKEGLVNGAVKFIGEGGLSLEIME